MPRLLTADSPSKSLQGLLKRYYDKNPRYKSPRSRKAALTRDLNYSNSPKRLTTDFNQWRKNPRKWDFEGIDTGAKTFSISPERRAELKRNASRLHSPAARSKALATRKRRTAERRDARQARISPARRAAGKRLQADPRVKAFKEIRKQVQNELGKHTNKKGKLVWAPARQVSELAGERYRAQKGFGELPGSPY